MNEPKKVKISKQRQITIPQGYFDALQIQEEVTIELIDDGLLIRPVRHKVPDDFKEQLLKDFKEVTDNTGWTTFRVVKDNDTK